MKKKIAVLVLLILVMTFVFTGCNMVTLNKEVDDSIVVAKVNYYDRLQDTVTKKELKEMFATQGQLYIYYYGWTPERAYDFCVEALAQQKLSKLKALDEICKEHNEKYPNDKLDPVALQNSIADHLSFTEGTKPSKKTIYDDILFVDEKISVLNNFNKQLQDAIDSLIKEIEQEELLNKPQEEEKPEEEPDKEEEEKKDVPAIREVRPKEEEKTPEIKTDEEHDKLGDLADREKELDGIARFDVKWNKDMKALDAEINKLKEDIKVAAEADKKALQEKLDSKEKEKEKKEEAYSRLERRLAKNGKTRDEIFESLVENMLVSHYRLTVITKDKANIDKEVEKANASNIMEIINANKAEFEIENTRSDGDYNLFLESKYQAAVTGGSPVYYHPIVKDPKDSKKVGEDVELGSAGYAYTFNILLNFNKNDAEMLKQLKAKADQTGRQEDKDFVETKKVEYAKQIKVNISNPYYDPAAKCTSGITGKDLDKKENKDEFGYHKCADPNCPLKPFGYDVTKEKDKDGNFVDNNKYIEKGVLTQEEVDKIKVGYGVDVVTVLKMINFDLQTIKNDTTITNPYDKQVKLREEFTKWMYKVNDDPGMFSKDNARGYLVPKVGQSSYVESYTNQTRELMGGVIDATDKNKVTYANPTYTEGVHFVGNYSKSDIVNPTDFDDFKPMIAISEFGIHIIMIAEMPGYYQADYKDENGALISNHILMPDAPFTYGRNDYKKVSDAFKDQVRKYQEGKSYEKVVKCLVKDFDDLVSVDKNAYKKLYEE